MNETELTPAAQLLIDAYLNTVSHSHAFGDTVSRRTLQPRSTTYAPSRRSG